ncbi:phospho-N-acetylmuramoyl-pentapeptide-transferase [Clostridium thermosuccinogenes]|uniref:phospho-N-acetylmuramoyl-pentapeptide- transferase n=1 Tax=Clostridium thermosuccinogenes TaxID=84032 RepID=UPI000CCC61B9|nr:phospho-N-acetylmuramoyl-pentapeptide-transferase [Pseudoclostridium thermosuccinogenes]PNT93190.1 phospho-N-acetylmuramoyl-pentapeptide-transferase [Pseudoclostridium thermosuccinogenes]
MDALFTGSVQVTVFVITFVLALIAGPILIPILTKLKFGQTVRDDGPKTHFKKMGTPTIGGLIFLIPITLVLMYFSLSYPKILPMLLVTLGFGVVGLIDDLIKVLKKSKDGLFAGQKMLGLLLIAAAFAFYIAYFTDLGVDVTIPFVGTVNSAWFFILFTIFVFIATTNGVNLTDGLDGLATGVTLIVMVFFTVVAMTRAEWDYIKVFTASVAGGCLGFLVFNIHPARVFMGDSGSLALGGAVASTAIMLKMPFILLLVGGIYVVEVLSDIIQVTSFKLRRKRVFKMAPLHHHFELSGWKETKVVAVFWTTTLVLCIIALLVLGVRFV